MPTGTKKGVRSCAKSLSGRSRVVPWMRLPASLMIPGPQRLVRLHEAVELAQRREVGFHIFDAGLHAPLLARQQLSVMKTIAQP